MSIDLHVHSTASDGEYPPAEVVRRAAAVGLRTIALTDHDTLAGVAPAAAAASGAGLRVVAGCEFSVAAPWGEMHLLGYFLPAHSAELLGFLEEQRRQRERRAREIVARLNRLGLDITEGDVLAQALGGVVGRPHVARALVARRAAPTLAVAFKRYLGWGRPAFVPKQLPDLAGMTALVRAAGGVTSAAHLQGRATRPALLALREAGVDGVEVLHPSHDEGTASRIAGLASELGLLPTGGSDWHGDRADDPGRAPLGSLAVPPEWLEALEAVHASRAPARAAGQAGGG